MWPPHRRQTSIQDRKAERELFFWTAFKALKLVAAIAIVAYLVVTLIQGDWGAERPSASVRARPSAGQL